MDITLQHLKKAWDKNRLRRIKRRGMFIGSEESLLKKYSKQWPKIDAVWSDNFLKALGRRNRNKKNGTKHIFISEICDIAVKEYEQVGDILNNYDITFVGSDQFIKESIECMNEFTRDNEE